MDAKSTEQFFKTNVLGHPAGLFVLFFTEMWERFSYYGMRALLVLFLVSSAGLGGWDWPRGNALALYGTYTSLVYLTPILGGYIADKIIGYRKAVIIGALLMTLGHASMAFETPTFLYIGLALLIFGNGFFKPNMTSIVSHMYKYHPEKKDGAYTIFYMGVNAGAFLGIMLCGYLGEKVGWGYGFGLAGIFMFLGMVQFYLAQDIFGDVGLKPIKEDPTHKSVDDIENEENGGPLNRFTNFDMLLVIATAVVALVWIINDPISAVYGKNIFGSEFNANAAILGALVAFLFLLFYRIFRYTAVVRDRMIAVFIIAIFYMFFWACFEQAGGSMTIFASDYTNRIMTGSSATLFLVVDTLITVIPVGIITWVLYSLFRQTFRSYPMSNMVLGASFLIIWGIIFWKINRDLNSTAYTVNYQAIETPAMKDGAPLLDEKSQQPVMEYTPVTESTQLAPTDKIVEKHVTIIEPIAFGVDQEIAIYDLDKRGNIGYVNESRLAKIRETSAKTGEPSMVIKGKIGKVIENQIEISATWFGILNSLFIIMFAPLFSRWWESKFNPTGSMKYGIGLAFLGIGFLALAYGSSGIPLGAATASVSIIWLVIAYLFHTLGELCISPVGLSYVSKLVPGRMIAMMFGIWYIAVAIGNKLAGTMGSKIDEISNTYGLSTFFLIFTAVPFIGGVLVVALGPILKRLMHGVR
jgi:POT family proton-dependent oligopeptide transporter